MANKKDIIREVAMRLDEPISQVSDIFEELLSAIENRLTIGEKVSITNFATFNIKHKKDSKCRHPMTKELMEIKGFNYPSVNFCGRIKDIIKNKK